MKKHIYYLPALLLAGCVAGGCEDRQEGVAFTPVTSGESIQFSVSTGGATSRTEYGEEDELGWTLNWERGDRIGIYTSASTDYVVKKVNNAVVSDEPNFAPYEILEVEPDGHKYEGDIWPFVNSDNDNKTEQLVWGDKIEKNPTLDFYGAYPAERIVKYPSQDGTDGNSFEMQYWTNQKVTVTEKVDNVYKTEPDMKNAYMIAKQAVQPSGEHILLHFDPIMTTLNITVTAGKYEEYTGIINPVTITGISVIMPKALNKGQFIYETDYTIQVNEDGSFVETTPPHGKLTSVMDEEQHTESVFVGVENQSDEEHKGARCVDLFEGESIDLMVFLPPVDLSKGALIKVHTTGALDYVLNADKNMIKQSRIEIQLPDVSPANKKDMYNNWISRLDPNTPIKQLSIPGYTCNGSETGEDITELLKKGVRAFDLDVFFTERDYDWSGHYDYSIPESDSDITEAFKTFIKNKTNENDFVIIWLKHRYHVYLDDNFEGKWNEDLPEKISDTNGFPIIALKNYNDSELNRESDGLALGKKICDYSKLADETEWNISAAERRFKDDIPEFTDNFDKERNANWQVWHIEKFYVSDDDALADEKRNINKRIYEHIANTDQQKGYTGIVMVPRANDIYDEETTQPTYSDLLIQSIIDCNYKFTLDKGSAGFSVN